MEPSDGITYSNHYEQSILDERIKKKIHTRKKRQWSKKDKRKKLAKKRKKNQSTHKRQNQKWNCDRNDDLSKRKTANTNLLETMTKDNVHLNKNST